jgi:hypothetical protein
MVVLNHLDSRASGIGADFRERGLNQHLEAILLKMMNKGEFTMLNEYLVPGQKGPT